MREVGESAQQLALHPKQILADELNEIHENLKIKFTHMRQDVDCIPEKARTSKVYEIEAWFMPQF